MKSLPEAVKNLLVAQKLVYFLGDDPQNPFTLDFACSLELEPTSPVKVTTISTVGGSVMQTYDKSKLATENFNILVRSTTTSTAYTQISAIADYLSGVGKISAVGESYRFEGFYQDGGIFFIGESKDIKAFNYGVYFNTLRNLK